MEHLYKLKKTWNIQLLIKNFAQSSRTAQTKNLMNFYSISHQIISITSREAIRLLCWKYVRELEFCVRNAAIALNQFHRIQLIDYTNIKHSTSRRSNLKRKVSVTTWLYKLFQCGTMQSQAQSRLARFAHRTWPLQSKIGTKKLRWAKVSKSPIFVRKQKLEIARR